MGDERQAKGYQPNWDLDRAAGVLGEEYVKKLADAENFVRGFIETKTDYRASETGNFYIEYECNGRPSGIAITTAETWYLVLLRNGVPTGGAFVETERLKEIARNYFRFPRYRTTMPGTPGNSDTRGVLIPLSKILEEICKA